jgi:hypothetical protein
LELRDMGPNVRLDRVRAHDVVKRDLQRSFHVSLQKDALAHHAKLFR